MRAQNTPYGEGNISKDEETRRISLEEPRSIHPQSSRYPARLLNLKNQSRSEHDTIPTPRVANNTYPTAYHQHCTTSKHAYHTHDPTRSLSPNPSDRARIIPRDTSHNPFPSASLQVCAPEQGRESSKSKVGPTTSLATLLALVLVTQTREMFENF